MATPSIFRAAPEPTYFASDKDGRPRGCSTIDYFYIPRGLPGEGHEDSRDEERGRAGSGDTGHSAEGGRLPLLLNIAHQKHADSEGARRRAKKRDPTAMTNAVTHGTLKAAFLQDLEQKLRGKRRSSRR